MIGCKPLSQDEVSRITRELVSERDKMLFLLGISTGFRISELLSIRSEHCRQGNITVERKNMKGKHSSRSVPLSPSVSTSLKSFIALHESFWLFTSRNGNRLSKVQAWRIIKLAAQRAGLEGKIATHSMRKTLAKRVYAASGNNLVITQKALGHKSVNSTISYLQVGQEEVDNLLLACQKE